MFFSATLNAAEQNYDIYDLELLAIVWSLEHWRTFLAGSPHKIKVFSDHMNLQYWKQPHKINQQVAREVLTLSEYDIEIHHIQGKANGWADASSRWLDYDKGTNDNDNVIILPDKLFIWKVTADKCIQTTRSYAAMTQQEQLQYNKQDKETLQPWIDAMQLKKIEGIWYKDGRCVVTGSLIAKRKISRPPWPSNLWPPRNPQDN